MLSQSRSHIDSDLTTVSHSENKLRLWLRSAYNVQPLPPFLHSSHAHPTIIPHTSLPPYTSLNRLYDSLTLTLDPLPPLRLSSHVKHRQTTRDTPEVEIRPKAVVWY